MLRMAFLIASLSSLLSLSARAIAEAPTIMTASAQTPAAQKLFLFISVSPLYPLRIDCPLSVFWLKVRVLAQNGLTRIKSLRDSYCCTIRRIAGTSTRTRPSANHHSCCGSLHDNVDIQQ